MQKLGSPLISKADAKKAIFTRYREHLRRAESLNGDFAVETAKAGAVLSTIATNGWLEDYREWMRGQL